MPKLDGQKRLPIPKFFRKKANLSSSVALCYDFEEEAILICNANDVADKNVIAYRTFNSAGRIIINPEIIQLLKASPKDMFIIYQKNNNIFMKKL